MERPRIKYSLEDCIVYDSLGVTRETILRLEYSTQYFCTCEVVLTEGFI